VSFLSGWAPPRTGVVDFSARSRTGPLEGARYLPEHFRSNGYTTVRLDKVFHIGADDPASWNHSEEPLFGVNGDNKPYWTGIELPTLGIGTEPRSFTQGGEVFVPVLETGRQAGIRGESGTFARLDNRVPEDAVFDGMSAARAVRYLEQFASSGEPFFLAVGFRRPHLPWIVHERYFDLYPPESIELPPHEPGTPPPIPPDVHRRLIQGYRAATTFVDVQVGRLLDALERTGLASNTVVVLIGDHGYAFGQRDAQVGKGELWDDMLRPAMIVAAPRGMRAGAAVEAPVGLLDLYPTVLDLAGLPRPDVPLDGASLAGLLAGDPAPWRGHIHSFKHERGWPRYGVSVRTATHRYSEGGDGSVELFDVRADPHHWNNLADDPGSATVRAELAALARRSLEGAAPIPAAALRPREATGAGSDEE
jgi:uncharacterized sulfatase